MDRPTVHRHARSQNPHDPFSTRRFMVGDNYKQPGKKFGSVRHNDAKQAKKIGGFIQPVDAGHLGGRKPKRCILQVKFSGPSFIILSLLLLLLLVLSLTLRHPQSKINSQDESPKRALDRRNFALVASGATVINGLTSKTYDPKQRRLSPLEIFFLPIHLVRTKWTGFDVSKAHLSLPRDAFTDGLVIGRCWEFSGSYGHIGVALSEPIVVTHISIDHVPSHLLSTSFQNRSPKRIVVWGLVEFSIAMSLPDSRSPYYFSQSASLPVGIPSTDRFVLLADVNYNISSPERPQSYRMIRNSPPLKILVFEILSNYGAPTTCLYHAGVHGNPVPS